MTCFALSFFLLPFTTPIILLIVLMGMINFAYSLFSLTLKATLAEWLPVNERIKAFSANYTLVNVGWAIGPPLSVAMAATHPLSPFLLAGIVSLFATVLLGKAMPGFGPPPVNLEDQRPPAERQAPNFRQTLTILRQDRRLIWFTLGGTLGVMYSKC